MQRQSDSFEPVGVVPRQQARALETLMSDKPETCSVAGSVDSPENRTMPPVVQWLPTVTAFTVLAAALEWLKLTR